MFRLWIDGRALPGSGRLIAGNVDIRPGPHASITGERTQAAALTLPKGCVKSGAASRVTGPRIRSVTWLVDGRKHAIVRRAVRRQTFTFRLPVRELGSGRHRLMAVVRQVSGRRQIIRRAFRVCA